MSIMLKLRFMEQSGKGTSLIVNRYGRKVYHFGTSYMQCILPYAKTVTAAEQAEMAIREIGLETSRETSRESANTISEPLENGTQLSDVQKKILHFLSENPVATKEKAALSVGLSLGGIKYHIDILRKMNLLKHQGATKKGNWVVYIPNASILPKTCSENR